MNNNILIKILLLITSFLLLGMIACSNNDAQNQFERDARNAAKGYTHTDSQGKIVQGEKDPDDWRIGPMFQGYVEIMYPPYPNPVTTTQRLTIQLTVTGLESVYGLNIYVRTYNPQPRLIYQNSSSPLPTGLTTIKLDPLQLSPTGNPDDARGLHRIFIYDDNDNLITYGDIMVQ
jgi:hypothetical protein